MKHTCITLLAISFGLLIASCNDLAIPEIEVADEEQKSAKPEPPELIKAYEDIWKEIELSYGKTGIMDSNSVLQANHLAVELAQYDGHMRKAFDQMQIGFDEVLSADSTDTMEDVLKRLFDKYGGGVAGKTHEVCIDQSLSRKDCFDCCAAQRNDDDWGTGVETMGGAAVCVGLGVVGRIGAIIARNIPAYITSTIGQYVCMGTTARNAYVAFQANGTEEELCKVKCDERFPELE